MKKPKKIRKKKGSRNKPKPRAVGLVFGDSINNDLKQRFKIKNLDYVIDNGIIKNSWMILNLDGAEEAITLLKLQKAPIYILGEHASAFVMWSTTRKNTIKGGLWKDQKQVEELSLVGEIDYDVVRQYIDDWCLKVGLEVAA